MFLSKNCENHENSKACSFFSYLLMVKKNLKRYKITRLEPNRKNWNF